VGIPSKHHCPYPRVQLQVRRISSAVVSRQPHMLRL
jgi:hypothetical protein